ncbi:MAG: ATP-dependent Clp protease ATP-binding subunit ClpX [Ignavibacteria bacterium]|nr:ATP-dependent Clp protease ATP-binding subunit ClpX [Ignavibacteria bacterium]
MATTDSGHPEELHCSFCGRSSREVTSLIAGKGAYMCDICVQNSVEILRKNQPTPTLGSDLGSLPKPSEIKAQLDAYVIGQFAAKEVLSVAVYNHYKRIQAEGLVSPFDDVEIEKSNILLLGPTGTGKTLLAQTLARILDVPFAIADATTLTEAGYVGDDVESIIVNLLQNADYNVERAERGIIYVDEIDKITRKSDSASITRDVSGEGVQQGLLKILEGTVAGIPPKGGRKHPEQPLIYVNTRNILFICGGAFEGLEKIITRRMRPASIGFTAGVNSTPEETSKLLRNVEPEDLMRFGFIPEFIGRLPVVTALDPLSDEAMMDILTTPRNALVKQYQKLLLLEGIQLDFDHDALLWIVSKAKSRRTGARALRGVMEEIMNPIMYELPDKTNIRRCIVTKDTVERKGPPLLEVTEAAKNSARTGA